MFDFILGLFLAGMLVRGWVRGFVREALDLVGLVVGLWIAFRLSAPFGDFLTRSFGASPEVARIGAGIALFFLFGATLSVAAHYLTKMMSLPGLSMVNRVGGAVVAVAWGVTLVLVFINLAGVLPIPESWEEGIEESSVAQSIVGPDALPQRLFESLVGDNLLGALGAIQDLFGTSRVVPQGDEALAIPAAAADEIRQVRDEAHQIIEEVNKTRAGVGARALVQSEGITEYAERRAAEMYTSGTLAKSPSVRDALGQIGIRVVQAGDAVALAGTSLGALEGILDTEPGRSEISDSAYDRVGVSVVDGPTGRLLVIVLAG